MERVKTYTYQVVDRLPQLATFRKSPDETFDAGHSNMQLYATEQLALEAAMRDTNSSSISIVILEKLATLPDHQVQQLQNGLPWSSKIDSSQINLETTNRIEHSLSQ